MLRTRLACGLLTERFASANYDNATTIAHCYGTSIAYSYTRAGNSAFLSELVARSGKLARFKGMEHRPGSTAGQQYT